MGGFGPPIHDCTAVDETWTAGTNPAMTKMDVYPAERTRAIMRST